MKCRGRTMSGSRRGLRRCRAGNMVIWIAAMRTAELANAFPVAATLTRFENHCDQITTRSDRRALWMACLGVASCEANPSRRLEAISLANKWMKEQPARVPLFRQWLEILLSQETLENVLLPTAGNQELRSVCPLAASIRPKEHRAALRFFQENLANP